MQPVADILAEVLKNPIVRCQQVYSGNSRVYEVQTEGDEVCIAKFYPAPNGDKRDRLGVEYRALSYLWDCGIRDIPRPLYVDRDRSFALYERIEGKRIAPEDITENDIAAAASFAGELSQIAGRDDSATMPDASEACFSHACYATSVRRRLAACERFELVTELHAAAAAFIEKEFVPLFREVEGKYQQRCEEMNQDWDRELSRAERTLSPSDFGFHNAIRRSDGCIAFVDFEYFGWDDPAKLIVDFAHHPAMKLSVAFASKFRERIISTIPGNADLASRVSNLFPLLGLKWCLIMLNEFLPQSLERRMAAGAIRDLQNVLSGQLNKAKSKLSEVEAVVSKGKDANMGIDYE
jgi:hypothetical protein